MELGFQFGVLWSDDDVIELRVSAWNGTFGGSADLYVAIGRLEETAVQLHGFPDSPSDTRELTFGSFDPKFVGGGVRMHFYCADGAGHSRVEANIESRRDSAEFAQSVHLLLPIEAASVDTFVEELRQLGVSRAGVARLRVSR
ncbi:MAG: hypothetical protein ABR921_21255 [Candidatus Sulfotelmatobacter sp.]